jgi:uncharacterized RDD family membrane protein YckC/competence protein ComGC
MNPPPQPPVSTVASEELVLPASVGQRLIHHIVDAIATYVLAFAAAIAASFMYGDSIGLVAYIVLLFGYHLIFESIFQRTIGKMLTGTKVVRVDGEKPTFGDIFIRSLVRYIPFEALSFLFYGAYPTKGWHDRLSKTLVVPKDLTPEQVRMIDPARIRNSSAGSIVAILIVVIVGSLVVLGVFASVVLASLNAAREKGQDASVKATITNIRAQAELYYDENSNSYESLCYDQQVRWGLDRMNGGRGTQYVCNDSISAYAVSGLLNTGSYYCVDSTGAAFERVGSIGNKTSCGVR